jgi:hypothetical protein
VLKNMLYQAEEPDRGWVTENRKIECYAISLQDAGFALEWFASYDCLAEGRRRSCDRSIQDKCGGRHILSFQKALAL